MSVLTYRYNSSATIQKCQHELLGKEYDFIKNSTILIKVAIYEFGLQKNGLRLCVLAVGVEFLEINCQRTNTEFTNSEGLFDMRHGVSINS